MARTKPISVDGRGDRVRDDDGCYCCARPLGKNPRWVRVVDGGDSVLHPSEWLSEDEGPGELGLQAIGPRCANRLGLEWSRPEEPDGDAECVTCGMQFFSGESTNLDMAVCGDCWKLAGAGPIGVVAHETDP